jgi:hypothetical protein
MFTCRTSQRDYFRIFTVAFRTTWVSTHGDLFLTNCHFDLALFEDVVSSLPPSRSTINSSRCFAALILPYTQPAALVDRARCRPTQLRYCSFPWCIFRAARNDEQHSFTSLPWRDYEPT